MDMKVGAGKDKAQASVPPREPNALLNGPFIAAAVIVGLLLAALGGFKLLVQPALIKGFMSKNVPPPATIATEVARSETWIARLPSVGTLTAIQGIDVAPQVAGIVTGLNFDSGTEVRTGDKLVTLDTTVEQADLANFQAALRQAEADLVRQNDLNKRAYASEATQQAAQAKRDSAAANVGRVKALIAQKLIAAPFAGRLGIRKVDIGQYVAPGAALVTLQQLDPIRVDFPVPEKEVAALKMGQTVDVTVDAFAGQTFQGKIKSFDARLAADTRTLLVRAEIPNADFKLLPGMFAKLNVVIGAPHDEITVPRTAVTYSLYGDSVYVVRPADAATPAAPVSANPDATAADLIVERRFVRISDTREDRVAISEGLKAGDQVVTTGQLKLQNNGHVRVDNSKPLTAPTERPRL